MDAKEAISKLPGRIKVKVNEDYTGGLIVKPVSENIRDLISITNEYNGSYEIYLQFTQDIQSFLEDYPQARYRIPKNDKGYKIGRYTYAINDNNVFLMDSWDFRHMIGGQSD